jgi:MFS family permease
VPTFTEILRQRSLWGASIGHFCGNYPYYLMLTWMPLFLVKYAHFSLTAMAWIAGGAYATQSLTSIVGGRMSDRLIRNGADPTHVRKAFIVTGYVFGATALLLLAVVPSAWVLPFIILDRVGTGLASPMTFTIGQTLGGPSAGGRWMGVQNLIGNLAGVAAPIVTGVAIDATGSFQIAFLIAVVLMLLCIVCWAFVIEEIEPVAWRSGGLLPAEA